MKIIWIIEKQIEKWIKPIQNILEMNSIRIEIIRRMFNTIKVVKSGNSKQFKI